nr:hypothetical protein CFP56_18432 [Quercus suber]
MEVILVQVMIYIYSSHHLVTKAYLCKYNDGRINFQFQISLTNTLHLRQTPIKMFKDQMKPNSNSTALVQKGQLDYQSYCNINK